MVNRTLAAIALFGSAACTIREIPSPSEVQDIRDSVFARAPDSVSSTKNSTTLYWRSDVVPFEGAVPLGRSVGCVYDAQRNLVRANVSEKGGHSNLSPPVSLTGEAAHKYCSEK